MSFPLLPQRERDRAEVYYGDEVCREKSASLLTEMGLPNWLLQFQDIKEFGYVNDTGFVWLKQKHRRKHKLEEIEGKIVYYDSEITAYLEYKKIKKLTGVKAKELFIWITLSEVHVDNPSAGTITFKTPGGLSKSFAISVSNSSATEAKRIIRCSNICSKIICSSLSQKCINQKVAND